MAPTQIEAGNESVAAVPVAAADTDVSKSLITADEYRVGDLVWCKIGLRRYPYWPARVRDPNQASAYALNRRRDGCSHFVTLFGDHMIAWCEPSQLAPFVQNFDRLSKAETERLRLFIKAMEEAAGVLASSTTTCQDKSDDVATGSDDKDGAPPRLRKRSKYLLPPYTDWSSSKKGSKRAKNNASGGGPVEEGGGMNVALPSLFPANAAPDKRDGANAASELNAIREKLEVTSVILKAYHPKFSDRDKASVAEDLNRLMEEVETMSGKVLRLAESTSMY